MTNKIVLGLAPILRMGLSVAEIKKKKTKDSDLPYSFSLSHPQDDSIIFNQISERIDILTEFPSSNIHICGDLKLLSSSWNGSFLE